MFDRFQQADTSTTRKFGGTGLGLTIVRAIAEGMGGSVEVRSQVGVGTTFEVRVPLPPHEPQGVDEDAPDLVGRTVWLFDRCEVSAGLRRRDLEYFGANVRVFDQRIGELPAEAPNAILIDVGFRELSELLSVLSESSKIGATPRVLICRSDQERRANDLSFTTRLRNPFLPRALAEAVLGARQVSSEETDDAASTRPSPLLQTPLHVLVAEDNAVNARIIQSHLRVLGCSFEVAVDGREAVELAASGNFDLILMDGHMPNLDGFDATKKIRATEKGATLPIIALTADSRADVWDCCERAGMNDLLGKPYKREQIEALLRRFAPMREPAKRSA